MKKSVVKVKFQHNFDRGKFGDKEYDYITLQDFKNGDLVVVETSLGYAVAKITATNVKANAKATRYVVQKVDTETIEELKLKDFELEVIKSQIDEEIEAMSYESRILQFAEQNPTLKALLEEYKNLKGDN